MRVKLPKLSAAPARKAGISGSVPVNFICAAAGDYGQAVLRTDVISEKVWKLLAAFSNCDGRDVSDRSAAAFGFCHGIVTRLTGICNISCPPFEDMNFRPVSRPQRIFHGGGAG
jgi:hypothetical protein